MQISALSEYTGVFGCSRIPVNPSVDQNVRLKIEPSPRRFRDFRVSTLFHLTNNGISLPGPTWNAQPQRRHNPKHQSSAVSPLSFSCQLLTLLTKTSRLCHTIMCFRGLKSCLWGPKARQKLSAVGLAAFWPEGALGPRQNLFRGLSSLNLSKHPRLKRKRFLRLTPEKCKLQTVQVSCPRQNSHRHVFQSEPVSRNGDRRHSLREI